MCVGWEQTEDSVYAGVSSQLQGLQSEAHHRYWNSTWTNTLTLRPHTHTHTVKHFFRCTLIWLFSYVENLLHFNLAKFLLYYCLHITKNIAYQITEVLIFYAHNLMVMGNSKNLRVFNFTILLKLRTFHAHEIYMFYSTHSWAVGHWVMTGMLVMLCCGQFVTVAAVITCL